MSPVNHQESLYQGWSRLSQKVGRGLKGRSWLVDRWFKLEDVANAADWTGPFTWSHTPAWSPCWKIDRSRQIPIDFVLWTRDNSLSGSRATRRPDREIPIRPFPVCPFFCCRTLPDGQRLLQSVLSFTFGHNPTCTVCWEKSPGFSVGSVLAIFHSPKTLGQ